MERERTCEYQDGDVMVQSREPLRGKLELMADDDEPIWLSLDRENTEWLMSVLMDFLSQGEGADALNVTQHSEH